MFPLDFPTDVATLCLQLFMCYMYSGLLPIAMPIFTIGLMLTFFCKRYVILNYTVRIPADESLNEKIINLIPFIILVHGLFSVWVHTVDGFYDFSVFFLKIQFQGDPGEVARRAMYDLIQLAAVALILVWIIFDWTIFAFCGAVMDACKDELQLPVTLASLENENYGERIKNSNILGSYKIAKNPVFGHAYKAYKELKGRILSNDKNRGEDISSMQDENVQIL